MIDQFATESDQAINGLSLGEKEKPTKSERILETRRWIDKLTHIGPHNDLYEVTRDDALLAYRPTASMIGYLSKKSREGQARRRNSS